MNGSPAICGASHERRMPTIAMEFELGKSAGPESPAVPLPLNTEASSTAFHALQLPPRGQAAGLCKVCVTSVKLVYPFRKSIDFPSSHA
jgi:hypothetical protein